MWSSAPAGTARAPCWDRRLAAGSDHHHDDDDDDVVVANFRSGLRTLTIRVMLLLLREKPFFLLPPFYQRKSCQICALKPVLCMFCWYCILVQRALRGTLVPIRGWKICRIFAPSSNFARGKLWMFSKLRHLLGMNVLQLNLSTCSFFLLRLLHQRVPPLSCRWLLVKQYVEYSYCALILKLPYSRANEKCGFVLEPTLQFSADEELLLPATARVFLNIRWYNMEW